MIKRIFVKLSRFDEDSEKIKTKIKKNHIVELRAYYHVYAIKKVVISVHLITRDN